MTIRKTKWRGFEGICKKSPQGNTNFGRIFLEGNDGRFRCREFPNGSFSLEEMLSDKMNGYVKELNPRMGI